MVPVITYSRVQEVTSLIRYRIASGPTTSSPSSKQTPQSTNRPTSEKTLRPSSQPTTHSSSKKTPRPTSEPQERCYERELCQVLVKLGLCESSAYTAELKEEVCPSSCA
ncbi:hypothetical protein KIN20_032713 [Parelaphostrongylus tenuis]|uniref:Uncharacterized protein n=1 Tax=Parelaphostrongylus tenuis TaxID=148309 RepID=A0AAD5R7C3_PARTN|nr:hypothetical protein KIN20_032713 [Parelaphostrongylus tenuis]